MNAVTRISRYCCLALVCSLASPLSQAEDEINWVMLDYHPFWILEGPEKGRGVVEEIMRLITPSLPEYVHNSVMLNMGRGIELVRRGEPYCFSAMVYGPEREKMFALSEAYSISTLNGVIILEEDQRLYRSFINEQGSFDLDKAFANDFVLGVSKSRSYGSRLDALFASFQEPDVYVSTGSDWQLRFLEMLRSRRISGFVGIGFNSRYLSYYKPDFPPVSWYPIAGAEGSLTAHMACPNNAWGRKIIERINPVIVEGRNTEKFYQHYFKWIPENSKPYHRKIMDERFGAPAKAK